MVDLPPHQPGTSAVRPEPEGPAITLTREAVQRALAALHQECLSPPSHGLRIGVITGGCRGPQYLLDFVRGPAPDDLTYEQDGLRVYVDPFSAAYLAGTVIDYVQGASGTGFRFDNPAIAGRCDCGASYEG